MTRFELIDAVTQTLKQMGWTDEQLCRQRRKLEAYNQRTLERVLRNTRRTLERQDTIESQAAEIERLKAEIDGFYEDAAGEDI